MYWIFFSAFLAISIFAEWLLIKKQGSYKGWFKTISLSLLYGIILLILGMYIHKQMSINKQGWILIPKYIPLSMFIWWPVKNISLGLALHKDPTYLGTGRWDRMWKVWPPALLVFFQLILITIGTIIYFNPNWIALGITFGILLIMIVSLFIYTRKN